MFLVLLCWCIISECTSALTRAAYVDAQLTLLSSGASPQCWSLPQEFHQRCKQLDESLFVSPDYHVCPSAIMDCMTTLDGLWRDLMQFDLLCTDTKLSLTRPLDPLSLIEMRAWLTFSPTFSFPKEREREVTCGLSQPDHLQEHQSGINHISSRGLDPSISPSTPCWDGPPNQIPATMFYISPQFQILPTVSDSTHWCFRFVALFPSPMLCCDQCHKNVCFFSCSWHFSHSSPVLQFK